MAEKDMAVAERAASTVQHQLLRAMDRIATSETTPESDEQVRLEIITQADEISMLPAPPTGFPGFRANVTSLRLDRALAHHGLGDDDAAGAHIRAADWTAVEVAELLAREQDRLDSAVWSDDLAVLLDLVGHLGNGDIAQTITAIQADLRSPLGTGALAALEPITIDYRPSVHDVYLGREDLVHAFGFDRSEVDPLAEFETMLAAAWWSTRALGAAAALGRTPAQNRNDEFYAGKGTKAVTSLLEEDLPTLLCHAVNKDTWRTEEFGARGLAVVAFQKTLVSGAPPTGLARPLLGELVTIANTSLYDSLAAARALAH